jgi:hypothetical protein
MPQHAPAELDRGAAPHATARAQRRSAAVQQAAVDPTAQAVQRVLDESPRVTALGRMGDALAQRRSADGPVVQRRVGPDEGRPGMEVQVRATGRRGYLRGRVRNREGQYVGWVVQTQVRVDDNLGTQHYTFDEVDPVGAAPIGAGPVLASPAVASSGSGSGSRSALPVSDVRGLPPLTGGSASSNPNLFAASQGGPLPLALAAPSTVSVSSGSPATASAPVADSVIREGDGVQFTTDGRNWHDGYVTLLRGSIYDVFIDSKMVREMYPYSTVHLSADQVRTSPAIKARMGAKRTKSSKREYRPDRLASPEQVREVQGQYASVSPLLLRHPVLFGPILRSGGHTGTAAVSAVGKDRGMSVSMPLGTKGKSRNRPLTNAIVATDTNAMLVTRLDDASKGPGQWLLHGKAARADSADHPTLSERELGAMRSVDLADFRRRYVFSQGSTSGEAITLPSSDRRTQLHAEAKALRSRTWQHILDDTVAEFTLPSASSESLSVSAEPARETRRKVIAIVINRSSCGSAKKGSGFGGGCAQELATVIGAFWTTLGERLGVDRVARLRAQGNIRIEVSAAGQYEYEGAIERTAAAGARLALHPNYDFDRDMPEPMSVARYQYLRRLALINSGQASGSSGSGAESGEDSELARLLALIAQMRAPVRRPRTQVAHPLGQHQVSGMFNRGHSGRIACTSIAACALEQMLNSPGMPVDQGALMTMMAVGTDVDADLRRNLGGGGQGSGSRLSSGSGSGSGGASKAVFKVPAPKRPATARAMPSGALLAPSLMQSLLLERPLTSAKSPTLLAPSGSMSLVPAPSKSLPKKPPSSAKRERSESAEERYFAHDEVHAQFPGMRVDQAAIDAAGPQYLYGVRGDYRRIARQLTRGGPRTGLLVTIGGATIMVANLSTRHQVRFALFDSHNQAIFETYDSELGLAEAIEDLYPALPGVEEMDAAWYATPYRPT